MSEARPSASRRGYSARWRKASTAWLKRPVNRMCAFRCGRLATTVDHVTPHKGDQRLFWDSSNWQGLCASCHSALKQQQERGGFHCDVGNDGVPTDPAHPFLQDRE